MVLQETEEREYFHDVIKWERDGVIADVNCYFCNFNASLVKMIVVCYVWILFIVGNLIYIRIKLHESGCIKEDSIGVPKYY